MRTTKAELQKMASEMNRVALNPDGGRYYIGWAYGRPRVCRLVGKSTCEQDVSPRLPSGQLADWMHGFLVGVRACNDAKVALAD